MTTNRLTLPVLILLAGIAPLGAGQGGSGGGVGPDGSMPPLPVFVSPPAPAPTPEGTGAISGVVMDASAKAPLEDAVVYLAIEGRGTVGSQSRQVTDAKGRFAFVNLPPGEKYTVTASQFGYLDGGYSRDTKPGATNALIALKDGEWIADTRILLWHPGAIAGTIVDERAEPVVGVFVRVLSRIRIHGRDELAAGPITMTDDRGVYRVAGLAPGRYLVEVPSVHASAPASALPASPGAMGGGGGGSAEASLEFDSGLRLMLRNFPTPPPAVDGHAFAYPLSFHPGTPAVASATEVDLKYGEERSGVDITLQPVPAWRVSGTVDGPPESLTGLTLRLIPEGLENLGQGSEAATALVSADGRFTFLNVPAGSYTIDAPRVMNELTTSTPMLSPTSTLFPSPPGRAGWSGMSQDLDIGPPGTTFTTRNFRGSPPNYWGRASVVVNGHDETDVVVTMRPAGTMSGRIVTDIDPGRPTPTLAPVRLLHLEPAMGNPALGYLRPELADFTIQGLLAGSYVLRSSLDWVVKSITWKGRDYTDSAFDAAETQDFSGVEVVVTNNAPLVTGSVRDNQGAPAEGATVVFFPVDHERWTNYGFSPPRMTSAHVSNAGAYRVTTLPAGDYYAIALADSQPGAWQDPAFLAGIEGSARRVTLAWGESKTVDLTVGQVK